MQKMMFFSKSSRGRIPTERNDSDAITMRDLLIALAVLGSVPFILRNPFIGLLVWGLARHHEPTQALLGLGS